MTAQFLLLLQKYTVYFDIFLAQLCGTGLFWERRMFSFPFLYKILQQWQTATCPNLTQALAMWSREPCMEFVEFPATQLIVLYKAIVSMLAASMQSSVA